MSAPLLVFGWGNPSRGDDALGPLFVERLQDALADDVAQGRIEFAQDFQLQIEHALDLAGRERVLFVDASTDCAAPFELLDLKAAHDPTITSHALSPAAVMQVYRKLNGHDAPPSTLLAIRGERFVLGEPLGEAALRHLDAALEWARGWVRVGVVVASSADDQNPAANPSRRGSLAAT